MERRIFRQMSSCPPISDRFYPRSPRGHRWVAPLADDLFEFAHYADAAERSIDHGRQAFAVEVINDAEDAEAPTVTESVRDEVE